MKLVFLGNECIEEDSLGKKIEKDFEKEFEIINVKDSFQLMSLLNENSCEEIILIDVVKGLEKVRKISVDDLSENNILSAHDFDAGYVLKLIGKQFKIIGIPQSGDEDKIKEGVLELIKKI